MRTGSPSLICLRPRLSSLFIGLFVCSCLFGQNLGAAPNKRRPSQTQPANTCQSRLLYPGPWLSETQLRISLEQRLPSVFGDPDPEAILSFEEAIHIAKLVHGSVKRDNGAPYLEQHIYPVTLHSVRSALTAGAISTDDAQGALNIILTAILHDSLEDSDLITFDWLRRSFGDAVARSIFVLSKAPLPINPYGRRQSKYAQKWSYNYFYVQRLSRASLATIIVKIADRTNNVYSTLARLQNELPANGTATLNNPLILKSIYYVYETEYFYMPVFEANSTPPTHLKLAIYLEESKRLLSRATGRPWHQLLEELQSHF
jgi:hypothetical protein